MTSRIIRPPQAESFRPRGLDHLGDGSGPSTLAAAVAAAGGGDDGANLRGQGTKRRYGADADDATEQVVSDQLKKQRQSVASHLPAHMRLNLNGSESKDDDANDGGGDVHKPDSAASASGTSSEITVIALAMANQAHTKFCRACQRGPRRDAPKGGALEFVLETIKTQYNGKNADIITDAIYTFCLKKWPKGRVWTKESIHYHITHVSIGFKATVAKQKARVDTMLACMDNAGIMIQDQATKKEYVNIKAGPFYLALMDKSIAYAKELGD
jgi:hypothetical protein